MYQSQCGQINPQCFQHLAPHTDGSTCGFQIFPLEAHSSICYRELWPLQIGLDLSCFQQKLHSSARQIPKGTDCFRPGLWSAVSCDGVSIGVLCLLLDFLTSGRVTDSGCAVSSLQRKRRGLFQTVSLDTLNESFQFRGLVVWLWPSATFHLKDPVSLKCAIFSSNNYLVTV